MNNLQKQIKESLDKIVQQHDVTIVYSTYQCAPNELIDHKEGDVYIEAATNKSGSIIKAYIYNDEASVKIEGRSFLLERPDYENDSVLIGKALVNFIQYLLKGETPSKSLKMAKVH